jgi:hypothetical protein
MAHSHQDQWLGWSGIDVAAGPCVTIYPAEFTYAS